MSVEMNHDQEQSLPEDGSAAKRAYVRPEAKAIVLTKDAAEALT